MSLCTVTPLTPLTPLTTLFYWQACYSEKVEVTTSSTSYPSQYAFPRRNDYCLVIRKIDKICQVAWRASSRTACSLSQLTADLIFALNLNTILIVYLLSAAG